MVAEPLSGLRCNATEPASTPRVYKTGKYVIYTGYPSGSNVEFKGEALRFTEHDIKLMRDRVERFGVEHVHNTDVLFELAKLNRKALRVFTVSRRQGKCEVAALVDAVWSLK